MDDAPSVSPLRQPTDRRSYLLPFRGSAHPAGQDEAYNGMLFTKKDLEEQARRAVGTPIWYEHDGAKKIGWVTRGFVDARGRLMIDGVIDRRVKGAARAIAELRSGTLKGLSLGLEHLVNDYGEKGKRVVAHIMEEVSLTADPDLPDTEIAEVAEDPEMWQLMNRYIDNGIETRKTKNALNKKSEQLLELLNKPSTHTPPSDFILPDTNKVGQDTEVVEEEQEVCTTVANSGFALDPALPEPAHFSTQPAPMSTPDQQAPAGTTPGGDMSKSAALEAKIAEQEKALAEMKAQLDEKDSVLKSVGPDPNKAKRVLEQHKARTDKLRQKYLEETEETKQQVMADMIAAGIDPDKHPEILEAIERGPEHPNEYKPLRDYVKTAAGAAAKMQLTKVEAEFQKVNAEKNELQKRLDDAAAAQQTLEQQFKQQGLREQRAAAYGAAVSGAPVAAVGQANQRGQKRARMDEPEDAASTADGGSTMFFGVGSQYGPNQAYLAPSYNPFEGADDPASAAILDLFARARRGPGMGKVDMRGIVGKQYSKPNEGLTADGQIDSHAGELRSQAPPVALPQTGFGQ